MPITVPEQSCFTQSGSCGDDREIASCSFVAVVQFDEIGRHESGDAMGIVSEVINQPDLFQTERATEIAGIYFPREIGQLRFAMSDGSGDAEAGVVRFQAVRSEECS